MLTNLVISVIDDIVLQKICRHLELNKKTSQVSPLLQLRDSLQQPVEDWVNHRFAASHQTLSEAASAGRDEGGELIQTAEGEW